MTKEQTIATINRDLTKLSEAQAREVMEYVEYLASGTTFYETAPRQVRDSVERGLGDIRAGRVIKHADLLAEIDARIAATPK